MATFDMTGVGGAVVGGKGYVVEQRASTLALPCGCCTAKYCQDTVEAILGFPLPETWTFEVPSPNPNCCAFNRTFELYYTGSIVQEANQNQPGILGGCFLNWRGPNPCPGPNGNAPMGLTISLLGPPNYPAGTLYAQLSIPTGNQNVAWQTFDFDDTFTLTQLIGTSSSCSTNFGGGWVDTLDAFHTAFPVFDFQTLRFPCTPSAVSPNGAWIITYSPGFPGNGNTVINRFTYDTTSGDFSGSNGSVSGGTFSGNFNFATGAIVVTSAGTLFTGTQRIQVQVQYSTPSDYPPTVTLVPGDPLDCPACEDPHDEEADGTQDRTCQNFELILTKDFAVAGGPKISAGRYMLILGTGYRDIPASGFTSVGCGFCQWNYNHLSGQVGFMMTPGTLSFGLNPTVTQMSVSSPTHGQSSESAFECLWTSYMDWPINTDNGLPRCDCWTPITDGMWIVPNKSGSLGPVTVWKPRASGGVLVGGAADVS